MYETLNHYIDGKWVEPTGAKSQDVMNPAKDTALGKLGHASKGDLDKAIAAAEKGFQVWRKTSAYDRSKILRKAADLVRERADAIATVLTMEQGKVLAERSHEEGEGVVTAEIEPGAVAAARAIPDRFWLHDRGALAVYAWNAQRLHGRRHYRRRRAAA